MIVLHAIWSSTSRLSIWGEDSALAGKKRPPASKPLAKSKTKITPHPFACEPDWLREALGHAGAGLLLEKFVEAELTLLLPSTPDYPQASPQLLRVDEEVQAKIKGLSPWRVPVLQLSPANAIDLFFSLTTIAPGGVAYGESLKFFGEAAKFALELVARGRIFPTLIENEKQLLARWQPLTDDNDIERWRLLTHSMPSLCRAEAINNTITGRAPDLILRDMIECTVDACVRESLVRKTLVPAQRGQTVKKKSAVEVWLAALSAQDASFQIPTNELSRLKKDLSQWGSGMFAATQASLRTCFRLSPPDNGDEKWRLDFLLQATDDRSLLVGAEAIWKTKGEAFTFLKRKLENPQERLLEDLGRAARLYTELENALRTAKPIALDLDTSGAHRFLREAAPLLEQAGFGVLVPPWWKKPNLRLGVRLVTQPRSNGTATTQGLLGIKDICNYKWEIALGDEQLSYEDFKKLAKLKQPLVQIRGQWVELKREEIDAALNFFTKRNVSGKMTVAEVLRIGMGIDTAQLGLPVVGFETQGWLKELINGNEKLVPLKVPASFVGKLRPYQERGVSWLAFLNSLGLGACLADDMGLGKTIQLLVLLIIEREKEAKRLNPTLLICPMSVVGNWQREAARFTPTLKVHVHHGAERLSGKAFAKAVRNCDLVITTYALAARDQKLLSGVQWARVTLDEAQNIKNRAAKQTQAVCSFSAEQRVALTGTPVENRLSELWSIMEFLNSGLFGSANSFRENFAVPIERYRDEEKAKLLKRLTGPFVLRRLKTDKNIIRDLPDKMEMKVYCNLTREQASLYQAVVDDMLKKIEQSSGIERKGLVLAAMLRLKQVCNHPTQLLQDRSSLAGRSGKLARLEETLEEILAEGDKVLCFTQFAEMGHLLKGYLQEQCGREVLYLYGATTKRARDEMVARFQQADGPSIFLLSLKAGGTGLNLTAASHVIHFDRWWNPAVENQATDRAFRIGQRKNVQVRKFICVGTLEERIDRMIEQKKELAERIVGSGESWLTELSTAQLRELITLSADAVSE
ncbi:MAG: DEAD/DEAH box helicase [Acidobacteriota bacterium]